MGIATVNIPYFPEVPSLSDAAIKEITQIVFDTVPEPTPCDAIFIFGGSHPGLWINGAEAYKAGLGNEIIVTGGHKPTALGHHTWTHGSRPEAEVIRDELIDQDVPKSSIYFENRSTNTLENVLFAKEKYDFGQVNSILAICKSYGAGRQCRTLRHHIDKQITVIPYPFDTNVGKEGPIVTRENWMTMPKSRAYVFGQFLKVLKYGDHGHLEPIAQLSTTLQKAVQEWMKCLD